jgi:2,4'-dihydroxyacetophenone dioxygenase
MHDVTFELARPLDTGGMPWIPTGAGKSFRPLRFAADGWSELMRLEPGSSVAVHRHTGEVHAFNLSGAREIFGTGEVVGPGAYVYEPAGTVDGWGAIGDEPCVIHIKVVGTIEYLGPNGAIIESVDAGTQRAVYLAWCEEHGVEPAEQILG